MVFQATNGAAVRSPQVRDAVTATLAKVATVPGVESVAGDPVPAFQQK